jgi:hypothetical protein
MKDLAARLSSLNQAANKALHRQAHGSLSGELQRIEIVSRAIGL